MNKYDKEFESIRLQQLQKQTICSTQFNGKIVFGCEAGSNQIGFSSWFFSDDQLKKLESNNFKFLIQPLIEDLAQYRQLHKILPNQCCILTIADSSLDLKWLADSSAENLISDLRKNRHLD